MINHNKRGLSAIVATLIVVLLAIVAFGIISGFIQDVVTGKTEEAELASSDTRLNVQKASVEGNMSSVSVRREGSDDLEVVGSRVVFDSGDGRAVASSNFTIGKQELDTFSIPLCSEEFSDVDFSSEDLSATVYPIVMYEGERTMLDGNPSSVDFVEVDGPELVENCNKSQSSESGSDSGTGDSLPACTDSDGDGYVKESSGDNCNISKVSASNYGDCNDNSESINPGTVWYEDADSDGHYVESVVQCESPAEEWRINASGEIISQGDCNDNDPSVYESCEADVPSGGLAVEQERVQAFFDDTRSPPIIRRNVSLENLGSNALLVELGISEEIRNHLDEPPQEIEIEGNSNRNVTLVFENPGNENRWTGNIELVPSEGNTKEVGVEMGVFSG